MKIYLAAPLFSEAERTYNEKIKVALEKAGFQVFLPQEGCEGPEDIFQCCIVNLKKCDAVLAVLDGAQVDDGTAFECGVAHALGIPVVGLRTDFRRVGEHDTEVNLMLLKSTKKICRDVGEVMEVLKDLSRRKNEA
jgi:nucleoside 2-deoxyribosyltransferase